MHYTYILQSKKKRTSNRGFVALFTAIILSAILITVTIALNQIGFLTRSEISDAEYKNRSLALAEACIDTTLLKLATNPSYAGGETINVGTDTCEIRPVQLGTPIVGQNTIETRSIFQEATTNLQIVVNAIDFSVVSWNELPSF